MSATALALCTGLLGACGFGGGDPCAAYAERPDVFAQCILQQAPDAPTIEAARCDQAGDWELSCRIQWISHHGELPFEVLWAACPEDSDECRMTVLDWYPLPLAQQVAACSDLSGQLPHSCLSHALTRVLGGRPNAQQLAEAWNVMGDLNGAFMQHVARAGQCGILIDCRSFGYAEMQCRHMIGVPLNTGNCDDFHPAFPRPRSGNEGLRPH
ncbi:MAG: hypothetical protein H6742_01530 [Alphaproteobacteria bacterium]|nr:hypothetical protein [Alphaproteobacteria bacterium]